MTVKIFFPCNWLCTSDGVGIWYLSRLIALFKGLGSRHIRNDPFRFSVITRLCTQSVGLSTLAIISSSSSLAIVSFSWSYFAYGSFRGAWMTGRTLGSTSMSYSFSNIPTPLNTSLYSVSRSSFVIPLLWDVTPSTWTRLNKFMDSHASFPRIGMSSVSVTKNSITWFRFVSGHVTCSLITPTGLILTFPNAVNTVLVGSSCCIGLMRRCVLTGNTLAWAPESSLNVTGKSHTLSSARQSVFCMSPTNSCPMNSECSLALSPVSSVCTGFECFNFERPPLHTAAKWFIPPHRLHFFLYAGHWGGGWVLPQ